MTWKLDEGDHRHYRRNPLRQVIAQIRFQPILRIPGEVAVYQDQVRQVFPSFRTKNEREVRVNVGEFEVREEKYFLFSDSIGRILSLTSSSMTLESPDYRSHNDFFERFNVGLKALVDSFEPIDATRIGLRYVNFVEKELIEKDLKKELSWHELIAPDFLHLPRDLVDEKETNFNNEIVSPVADAGKMFLRYGLRHQEQVFVFDMDRFLESDSFEVSQSTMLLESFSDQCSFLFGRFVTENLAQWMDQQIREEVENVD